MRRNFYYEGRLADGEAFAFVNREGVEKPLDSRLDLSNSSPSGVAWGYRGSGPAQLALAILADYFQPLLSAGQIALALHQSFKSHVVATWPTDAPWTFSAEQVGSALLELLEGEPDVAASVFSRLDLTVFDELTAGRARINDDEVAAQTPGALVAILSDALPMDEAAARAMVDRHLPRYRSVAA